jgi:uncharacterized Zn finger protein
MSRPQRRNSSNAKNAKNSKNAKSSKNRRKPRPPADSFWNDGGYAPKPADKIRPTPDPAALPRSLGDPPLTQDTAAEHHLAVVYEEAVRTATALAAVNGLLWEDESATL